MLVKKGMISKIDMVENGSNDFCVRFYLDTHFKKSLDGDGNVQWQECVDGRDPELDDDDPETYGRQGEIIIPCFWSAGFDLDEPWAADAKAKQLELTQAYLNKFPDDAYVELSAGLLYDMDVYH